MELVKKIAVKELSERRNAILARLDALNVKWQLQRVNAMTNIRVPLKPGGARLVIGAHYDNFSGSTGANDNASSCSLLLRLIEAVKDTAENLEFVFFDGEEDGGMGSRAYIQNVGRASISAMVNLDVCGHGDVIVLLDNGHVGDLRFRRLTNSGVLQAHGVMQTGYMPIGDHSSFIRAGIPTVAICTLSRQDAELFRSIDARTGPTYEKGMKLNCSDIISTMHGGSNDSIAAVSQTTLDMVMAYLLEGLS